MIYDLKQINNTRVLICSSHDSLLASEKDTDDLLTSAWQHEAGLVAISAELFSEKFFQLSSGLAGSIVQRFVNYRMPLAIIGDVSAYTQHSNALSDYIREANRGRAIWFMDSIDALKGRLSEN
jgi:hypothetical protein